MSLGDFDLGQSAENQQKYNYFEELGTKIGQDPEFYLNDIVSALTIGWIIAFIIWLSLLYGLPWLHTIKGLLLFLKIGVKIFFTFLLLMK